MVRGAICSATCWGSRDSTSRPYSRNAWPSCTSRSLAPGASPPVMRIASKRRAICASFCSSRVRSRSSSLPPLAKIPAARLAADNASGQFPCSKSRTASFSAPFTSASTANSRDCRSRATSCSRASRSRTDQPRVPTASRIASATTVTIARTGLLRRTNFRSR